MDAYSQEDLLTNSLYIFFVLLAAVIVFVGIAFGVREYCLSVEVEDERLIQYRREQDEQERERKREQDEQERERKNKEFEESKRQHKQVRRLDKREEERKRLNKTNQNEKRKRLGKNLEEISHSKKSKKLVEEIPNESPETISSSDSLPTPSMQPTVSTPSPVPLLSSCGSEAEGSHTTISKFLESQFNKRYSYQKLQDIEKLSQGDILPKGQSTSKKKIKMSSLMRYSSYIPVVSFDSVWKADKTIDSLRSKLNSDEDNSTKAVFLLSLLSIGATYQMLDNPNFYLPSFTEFIEDFIDSGSLFNLLEQVKSQQLLIDMVVAYCWSHWNFKLAAKKIEKMYLNWQPTVQSHLTIIRLMCNFELGLCGLENLNNKIRLVSAFKVHTLFKESAKCLSCTEYIGIIPVLAEAIELSDAERTTYLFYEVLAIIVERHSSCCMGEYLEEDTDLNVLIDKGILHEEGSKVWLKASEVQSIIHARR